MFKIIKKGTGNFWHNFNNGSKEVNLSNWEIVLDSINQTVSLQMLNGANVPINSVDIADVVVIDETDISLEETFGSVSALRTRLIELNYTPYIVLNGFVPEAPIDGLTYGRKDAGWVEVSGGGGSVGTLQQVTDNGNRTTKEIISTTGLSIEAVASGGKVQRIVPGTGIPEDQNFTFPNSPGGGALALESSISGKEDTANKVTSITGNETSSTLYASIKGIVDWLTGAKIRSILGISTLSGSNTGDQDLSGLMPYAIARTGSSISFDVPAVYNSISSPTSSNITNDLTGAKIGIVQKIYSNKATEPTYPAGWVKLSGTYTNSVTNIIYAEWCEGSRVEYWIVKA